MKKNSTGKKNRGKRVTEMRDAKLLQLMEAHANKETISANLTIGLDIGDRLCTYCVLDENARVIGRGEVATEKGSLELLFGKFPASLAGLEVGTHSQWISRLLEKLGHEVVVANARRVQLISEGSRKTDRRDAEFLARLVRADRELLAPIRHRGEAAQTDLLAVRVRAQLVELRTQAVSAARGLVKPFGVRLPSCDADGLNRSHAKELPPAIRTNIEPLLLMVEQLTAQIEACDKELKQISAERYGKETTRLQQINGVGPITSLSFVLTLEDPKRFAKSRDVGCYLGLRPKSKQSGDTNPEMHISKEGDPYLRKLLVQCSQYILSRRGPDTDLKRWGLQIAAKGKKNAKRRAVVAVARKLAVLLHRLWVSGQAYEPQRQLHKTGASKVA